MTDKRKSAQELKEELLRTDPEFKAAYESLRDEFSKAREHLLNCIAEDNNQESD